MSLGGNKLNYGNKERLLFKKINISKRRQFNKNNYRYKKMWEILFIK